MSWNNQRLKNKLQTRRKIRVRLLAFIRCAEAISSFDSETKTAALKANLEILGK